MSDDNSLEKYFSKTTFISLQGGKSHLFSLNSDKTLCGVPLEYRLGFPFRRDESLVSCLECEDLSRPVLKA